MKKLYSLIVIDDKQCQHPVFFEYFNPNLNVTEVTKHVPLKTIADFTTQFKSAVELVKFLKQKDEKFKDISIFNDVVIGYNHNKRQKFLNVAYSDAVLLKNVELEEKAIIKNDLAIDQLFKEICVLARNRAIFIDEILDFVLCTQLKDALKNYFYNQWSVSEIRKGLRAYRNYYELVLFCLNFRKKYHIGLETKEELAYQDQQYIQKFYLENLDAILKENHIIDDNKTNLPDRLFDDEGNPFDFYHESKVKKL